MLIEPKGVLLKEQSEKHAIGPCMKMKRGVLKQNLSVKTKFPHLNKTQVGLSRLKSG